MGKKSGSGSGMNTQDHIYESLETIFLIKILNFFDADPGSGMDASGIPEGSEEVGWLAGEALARVQHVEEEGELTG
jgi:hypothetical protein